MKNSPLVHMVLSLGLLVACSIPVDPATGPARNAPTQLASASPLPTQSVPTTLTNDFEPPVGLDPNAPPESPGEFRLVTATSTDGLTFTATGRILLDQASVPDLILGDAQRLYLYFTGGQLGNRNNVVAVAISDDLGETWIYKYVTFSGTGPGKFGDPDIVRLADGTFRLFATTSLQENQRIGIIYSDSQDGVTFEYQGVAFTQPSNVLDSTTFFFAQQWHMLVLDGTTINQWYATSANATSFTSNGVQQFQADGEPYVLANGVEVEGGYRLYGFSLPKGDIRSFFSTDGASWTAEPGKRLAFDPNSAVEGDYIKDPAVLRLPDNTYLMVYVTKIPKGN